MLDAESGIPIEAASVSYSAIVNDARSEDVTTSRTDACGLAVVAIWPNGTPVVLVATARGHAAREDFVRLGPVGAPMEPLVMRLPRAATIEGSVTDPHAYSVPWAHVEVVERTPYGAHMVMESVVAKVDADDHGRFVADGLAFGRCYLVRARRRGWAPSLPSPELRPTVDHGEVHADLALRWFAALDLSYDAPDGEPVGDVRVTEVNVPDRAESPAQLDRMDPGVSRLRVAGPLIETQEFSVELGPGERRAMKLIVGRGVALRGVVVDEDGTVIDDASVSAASDGEHVVAGTINGRFDLKHLHEVPHEVRAEAQGYERTALPGVLVPRDDLRIVLRRSGVLAFRPLLVDQSAAGAPPSRVKIEGRLRSGEPLERQVALVSGERVEVPWSADAEPELVIRAKSCFSVTRTAVVPSGATIDLGDVALATCPKLTLNVRAPEGLHWFTVWPPPLLLNGKEVQHGWESTSDGAYGCFPLESREAAVEVRGDYFAPLRANVLLDRDREMNLTFRTGGIVRVHFQSKSGESRRADTLRFIDEEGRKFDYVRSLGDDRLDLITNLDPGRYAVETLMGERLGTVIVRDRDLAFVSLTVQ